MDVQEKLEILADAAKYDVACTSSGLQRGSRPAMSATRSAPDAATASRPMGGAFRCSRFS